MIFREIEEGYAALKSFCYIMNMPPPMARSNCDNILHKLCGPYMLSGQKSM